MMITSEKATQKSITCSRLSVHQESFLWTLCQELVLSSWTACMRPCSSSRKRFGIAKRDPSLREATGPEHHRRVKRRCSPEGASPVLPGGPALPGAARFPPLPVVLCERVLDLAVLRPRQRVLPLQAEHPHVRQTRLLYHPSGGKVDRHRLRPNAAHAELGEALADQSAGAFGGVTLAPGEPLEPVAELVPLGAIPFRRMEGEPPHELPGGLLDGRPVAIPSETLTVLALDLLAGRRLAAVDETHDLEVVVECE